jgi:hypothetical protein
MIFSPRSDQQGCKVGAFALISKLDASEAFIEANRLRRILLSRKMNRASKIIVLSDGAARQNFTINFFKSRQELNPGLGRHWKPSIIVLFYSVD